MINAYEHVGRVRAEMDRVVVDHPRMKLAHDRFNYLMAHGQAAGQAPKRGVLMVGPSQSGKSKIIDTFATQANKPELIADGHIPVLVVTLNANITTKMLAQNILRKLGSYGFFTGPYSGNEDELVARVHSSILAARVGLMVLDEFHHLNHIEKAKKAYVVGEMLKVILETGVCPLVLSGIAEAEQPFTENSQLSQRSEPTIRLDRLRSENLADRVLLKEFLEAYLPRIGKVSGVTNMTSLLNANDVARIHEVTDGVLGAACNLIKAIASNALLDGRTRMAVADIVRAVDEGFILTQLSQKGNPFAAQQGGQGEKAA